MRKGLFMVFLLLAVCLVKVAAQDTPTAPKTSVYVTTQDFSSFRTGPGTGFDRLAIIAPVVTLPAYGRTSDTRWVQVAYQGQLGWVASMLLVWSGDIIKLPVDGVNPAPFVRRAAALGVTTRETPIYRSQVTPQDQIGVLPAGTQVELTGRLGGSGRGFFRFQIKVQDQLYWVGSWNIRVVDGNYLRLLDLAYLYPYGRLVRQLEDNLAQAVGSYSQISGVWQRLSRGDHVSCSPIPLYVKRILTDGDVRKEPTFEPAVIALDSAIKSINSAIAAFEDACGNKDPNFVVTRDLVNTQLQELDNAERSLILVGSLLEPLRRRNPLLNEQ
jgi:hypothetical protein